MDWGLGQAGSKRWGLRNTLLINHEDPWPYYVAVVMDFVLRLAWVARFLEGRLAFTDTVLTLELVEVRTAVQVVTIVLFVSPPHFFPEGSSVTSLSVLFSFWRDASKSCIPYIYYI